MRLNASIALGEIQSGGPGSGCQGPNCGRPKLSNKELNELRKLVPPSKRKYVDGPGKLPGWVHLKGFNMDVPSMKIAKGMVQNQRIQTKLAYHGTSIPNAKKILREGASKGTYVALGSKDDVRVYGELKSHDGKTFAVITFKNKGFVHDGVSDYDYRVNRNHIPSKAIQQVEFFRVGKDKPYKVLGRNGKEIRAGGPGSGCQGPNCGRHPGAKAEWVHAGLARLIRNELTKAGYKIQVYGRIPDTVTGKKYSLGEHFTYQHPNGSRATVSVGERPKDNYWAINHHVEGHISGKLYELKKVKKLMPPSSMAADSEAAEPPLGAYSRENDHEQDDWFDDPVKKKIKADFDGEPSVGMSHAQLDVRQTFHPPSLKKAKRVPADEVGETDDEYFDVTKRNSEDTVRQRMDMLKRSIPGGNPPQIPVMQTRVPHHTGVNLPSAMFGAERRSLNQRPVNWDKQPHQKLSYSRRGCM